MLEIPSFDEIGPIDQRSDTSNDKWQYILLDDSDLRDLVSSHFPQHLKAYDSFSKQIERVDFARCVMMHLGGVYADLDTYPVKSIDGWVALNRVVLGCEPREHAEKFYGGVDRVVLCNAFMISPPGHQIWARLMDYIVKNYEHNYKPVYNTGPMAMTKFMETNPDLFSRDSGATTTDLPTMIIAGGSVVVSAEAAVVTGGSVVVTDPCVFFPMTGDGVVSKWCRPGPPGSTPRPGTVVHSPQTYVVHEWENTWVVPWWRDPEMFNSRHWVWWGMLMLVALVIVRRYRRE